MIERAHPEFVVADVSAVDAVAAQLLARIRGERGYSRMMQLAPSCVEACKREDRGYVADAKLQAYAVVDTHFDNWRFAAWACQHGGVEHWALAADPFPGGRATEGTDVRFANALIKATGAKPAWADYCQAPMVIPTHLVGQWRWHSGGPYPGVEVRRLKKAALAAAQGAMGVVDGVGPTPWKRWAK